MSSVIKLVLVGFPNTGKTTLFNQLMGTSYKIGNWSGVTVKANKATFTLSGQCYELVDVPGILSVYDDIEQLDCKICRQAIETADILIHVVNGQYIHRSLILDLQLLCYEKPQLVVVTHEDKIVLNWNNIAAAFPEPCLLSSQVSLEVIVEMLTDLTAVNVHSLIQWPIGFSLSREEGSLAKQLVHTLQEKKGSDIQIAEGFYYTAAVRADRYGCRKSQYKQEDWLDQYALHPIYGVGGFFIIIYLMFFMTIGLGGGVGDLISGIVILLFDLLPQQNVLEVLIHSAGVGFATCIGFLPILAVMYSFIGYMEQSGYLSRIALLADSVMKPIGLSGHSFIPLMLGFGCNIPAVMATRVISGKNNRVLTALMVPFMSCSARLTIFALFAAAFFPKHGAIVIMFLYLLSLSLGVATVLMLNYVFQFEASAPLSVSLPSYQWPNKAAIFSSVVLKLKGFLKSNFKMIVGFSTLVGFLGRVDLLLNLVDSKASILGSVGIYSSQWLGFMGLSAHNWPASVALFSGIVAKEVVIATLNSLYQVTDIAYQGFFIELSQLLYDFLNRMWTFPLQLFFLDAGEMKVHTLYQAYFTTRSALAYMVFILLYLPCLSTMAVLKSEFGLLISGFSFFWTTFLAVWLSKITYWGIQYTDGLLCVLIVVIMKLVRYYYDTP